MTHLERSTRACNSIMILVKCCDTYIPPTRDELSKQHIDVDLDISRLYRQYSYYKY